MQISPDLFDILKASRSAVRCCGHDEIFAFRAFILDCDDVRNSLDFDILWRGIQDDSDYNGIACFDLDFDEDEEEYSVEYCYERWYKSNDYQVYDFNEFLEQEEDILESDIDIASLWEG